MRRASAFSWDGTKDYAILMVDPDGRVASWNAGAERLNGYRAEEIIGERVSRFYSRPDIDRARPDDELKAAEIRGRHEDQGWRLRKDGSRFRASVEAASLAQDRFLANLSHELPTPLNAIIGFTGTLLMRLPGPLTPDQDKQPKTVEECIQARSHAHGHDSGRGRSRRQS